MTNRQPVEIDVDELMAKVRAEVRRRNSLEEMIPPIQSPRVESPQAPGIQPDSDVYRVDEFLRYHDVDFVEKAYLGILGRPPDTSGYTHYVNELRQGRMTKVEILGSLRNSPEGKARSVVIKGLWAPYLAQRIFKVPVLGYFCRWLTGLLSLPTIIRNFQRLDVAIPFQLASLKDQLTDQLEANLSTAFQSQLDEIRRGKLVELTNDLKSLRTDLDTLHALMPQKADNQDVELLASRKADREAFELLASRMVSREDVTALLTRRGSREELASQAAQPAEQNGMVALRQWIADTSEQIQDLKANLLDQQRRLMSLLEEAGKRLPDPVGVEQFQNMVGEEEHMLDQLSHKP
jgi:hypothetical protein